MIPLPAASNPVGRSESTPAPGYCNQRSLGARSRTLSGTLKTHSTSASAKWARYSEVRVTHSTSALAASRSTACEAGENAYVLTTMRLLVTVSCSLKTTEVIALQSIAKHGV